MSIHDEYFKLTALDMATSDNQSALEINKKTYRSFDKPGKSPFRRKFISMLQPVHLFTESGLYIESTYKFPIDKKRLIYVVTKVARGLYWHHKGYPVPEGYDVRVACLHGMKEQDFETFTKEILEPMASVPVNRIGDEGDKVFDYKFANCSIDKDAALSVMVFFEWVEFFALIVSKDTVAAAKLTH